MWAGELLHELLSGEKTPGVPDGIREQARRILRHFPTRYDINTIARREERSGRFPMLERLEPDR